MSKILRGSILDKLSDCSSIEDIYRICEEEFEKFLTECKRLKTAVNENVLQWVNYFKICPASGNPKYHGCFKGGLFIHSVLVTLLMREIAENVSVFKYSDWIINKNSIIFTGIFHDIGKIGKLNINKSSISPYYTEGTNGWYNLNKSLPGHSILSIWNIKELRLNYSFEEYIAIMFHNGPYEDGFKYNMSNKENLLYLLLHQSDMIISREIEPLIQKLK